MVARYLVNVYDWNGTKIDVLDNWMSLNIEHNINNFSTHILSFDSREALHRNNFIKDYFIEVQRSDIAAGLDWYTEYVGFHRTPKVEITENRQHIFTSYGRGMEDLLARRTIAYRAPYEKNAQADNVMKELVRENAGSLATTGNGRIMTGITPGLDVAPDLGLAATWKGRRSYRNLLDVLREIAFSHAVDFRLHKVGPTSFLFKTYVPKLGSDLTLKFGPEFGNVLAPQYTKSATEEVTAVLVTGTCEGQARNVVLRTSTDQFDTPWNYIEITRDARNEQDNTALGTVGDAELGRLAERESFHFTVIQTPVTLYGRDYNLGDVITVRFDDIVQTKKITSIAITVSRTNQEKITFNFGDVETPTQVNVIRAIATRLQTIEHREALIPCGGPEE